MSGINSLVGVAIAVAGFMIPQTVLAQAHDADGHNHTNMAVDCTNLASPPWNGLPEIDRLQMASLQHQISALNTPEAAKAAGFTPVLGDIPGMGVHYVNSARGRDGVDIDAPSI